MEKPLENHGKIDHGLRRRTVLKALAAAGVGMAVTPFRALPARAEEQALYFTWGGYDIPELQPHYKAKYGALPQFATYGDDEEGLQKLRAGFVADVMHPCSADVPRWREAGVLQPIDVSRLSNWPDVHPRLQQLPVGMFEGKHYHVPWEWGVTSITYRTDQVQPEGGVESWGMLWDPKLKGKVAVIDSASDTWWCAAIYAGVPFDKIDDAALAKVRDLLQKLRGNVRLYTSDATTAQQALASGEVVAAVTWADSARELQKQGLPVKFAKPKEGTLAWTCGLALHKSAPHLDKAYDLIDGMLAPDVGAYCIETFGYGHSNVKSFAGIDEAVLTSAGLARDPEVVLGSSHFQPAIGNELTDRINQDWDRVKAGF